MEIFIWRDLTKSARIKMLTRPVLSRPVELRQQVQTIIQDINSRGDEAIKKYTQKFDQIALDRLQVTPKEFDSAAAQVSQASRKALVQAIANVECFHRSQIQDNISLETMAGVRCRREFRPIDPVGLYVPGGSAPLPSTAIMLAVPARLAACPLKIMCTPPRRDGSIDPHILLAAQLTGVDQVYKIGGVQAIAAMAYGSESIPKVHKIFGPGNSWVTEAKMQVALDSLGAAADMPAGPSEVLIIADHAANPAFIAADLLSQAEHGPDSQVILITDSSMLAEDVCQAVNCQLQKLPRKSIAAQALGHSRIFVSANVQEAFDIANEYGPEHLIVHLDQADQWRNDIKNAGSVFLGPWSPESAGDYASGTNHVLPTYGYAKALSGLSVSSFQKQITFQTLSPQGLQQLAPTIQQLAEIEGLEAHKNAVTVRIHALKGES